jgi:hypothetical protein
MAPFGDIIVSVGKCVLWAEADFLDLDDEIGGGLRIGLRKVDLGSGANGFGVMAKEKMGTRSDRRSAYKTNFSFSAR